MTKWTKPQKETLCSFNAHPWPSLKCTCGRKEGGGRNGSINCGVSKNEFFYYGKTINCKKIPYEMENIFHLKWESALVKWELVGGKKGGGRNGCINLEFPKMSSSITYGKT